MKLGFKIPRSGWLWLAAVLLMLGEFVLFDRMTSVHHASIYPRWNDQIQYLRESYTAYEEAKAHGLAAGFKFALEKPALQGTLHDTAALCIFWLVGSASRSAALSLNMLVFLAWQASLLAVVPRISGSRTLGWLGFALLPCLAGPWSAEAGSAVDFRLDHAAMCLLGLAAAAALMTRGFRSWRWSLLFGLAVAVTLLGRFLTGVYFAGIFLAYGSWILCGDGRWPRLRNLGLAGLTAAALAGPMFWFNRVNIYNYYWVGHITGAEGAARLRSMDLSQALQFVFQNFAAMHLGAWFGWTAAALTAALVVLWFIARKPGGGLERDWLFTALAFLLIPALVLTVHPQKSALVLGALVPGAVLLVLWAWNLVWQRLDLAAGAPWRRFVPAALVLCALGSGEHFFYVRQLFQPHSEEFLDGDRKAKAIADYIFNSSRANGIGSPVIGVDQIVDFMDAQILQVVCYERHKIWVSFGLQLPQSILTEKDEVVFYRLKLCDYMLVTDDMPGNGYWPYDQQMHRLAPQIRSWCDEHLHRAGTYNLFRRQMTLYERPTHPSP